MIKKLYLYEGLGFDPHYNLAVEEHLLSHTKDCCILYLWQNKNTVVIGKNQNAFAECRTTLLQEEGGILARRISGGGAVFHDEGNLNFTLLMPAEDYDLDKQMDVILTACRGLGVPAEKSGRNDILAEGRKFSGNAFFRGKEASYHHGTLMVSADMENLGRYLSPSKAKLEAKGVKSVRSRVCNLRDFVPDLTVDALKQALAVAFSQVYALPVEELQQGVLDAAAIEELRRRNGSWEWNYGSRPLCTAEFSHRLPWGGVELLLSVEEGRVSDCRLYTDAMEEKLPLWVRETLLGKKFTLAELMQALSALPAPYGEDLAELLRMQDI